MQKKFTPGPWRWELNLKMKQVKLCGGIPKYDLTVMDFVRWGMSGAQPRFLIARSSDNMILKNSSEMGQEVEGRSHHADWFQTISNPDAQLITCAPEMFDMLERIVKDAKFTNDPPDIIKDIEKLLIKATTVKP